MGSHEGKAETDKENHRNIGLFIVKAVLFLVFAGSAFMFMTKTVQARHEQAAFADLTAMVSETDYSNSHEETDGDDKGLISEETSAKILPQYEDIYEMNSDLIGWLSISDTNINYPVMFTPDDQEYYIHRAFDKSRSYSGTPFIGGNGDMDDDCFIIYGHNMKNNTMFGMLDRYSDEAFWKEHRTFSFNTIYEYREYEVFAAVKTRVMNDSEEGVRYYDCAGELSEEEYRQLEEWLAANSVYETGITPAYGDQILILSTCSYHTSNGRFIVAARRIS